MAIYRHKSTRQILEDAKRAQKSAEHWLNTQGKKIQADYDRVNAQFNTQMREVEQMNAIMGRSLGADVSEDELNAVMAEMGQSYADDLDKRLPSVPTFDPAQRSQQSKQSAQVKQSKPVQKTTQSTAPANAEAQKQEKIAAHFDAHFKAISSASTIKDGLKAILSAVQSVDKVHGTNSAGTYGKKLAARVQEVDKKMMPELKRRLAHQKKYPALSKNSGNDKRISELKNKIKDLKTDMQAYAQRVKQHCKLQSSQAMDKAAAISADSNHDQAPRGPSAR